MGVTFLGSKQWYHTYKFYKYIFLELILEIHLHVPDDWIHEKIDQYGQNSHTEPPSSMTMQVVNFTSQTHQSCCKYPFMMLINVNERLCVKGNGELNVFNPGLKNQRFDKPTAKSADEEGKKTHVMCCEVPQTQIIIAWSFYICVKG